MTTHFLREDDIADLRAYEKERPGFQQRVMGMRRRRRVTLGPVLTAAFESRDTVRYQIQEMLRAERRLDHGAVESELDAYNPLLPGNGELSVTLFVEVTEPGEVRTWLTSLAGLERHLALVLADGREFRARAETGHARTLTRSDVTPAVHYLRIGVPVDAGSIVGATLVVDHPAYTARTPLRDETVREILLDLAA